MWLTLSRNAPAALLLAALLAGTPTLARAAPHDSVLVLASAHAGDTWSAALVAGVEDALVDAPESIGRWIEHLDAYRFRGAAASSAVAELFRRKFSETRFRVVVTIGAPALAFVRRHRGEFFPDADVVFAGVSEQESAAARREPRTTGVMQRFDYRGTLDVALALRPQTRRLVFVSPDLRHREVVDELMADYRPDLVMELWHESTPQEILARAAELGPDAIVIPLAEPAGAVLPNKVYDRFVTALTRASRAPVFSVWDVALGRGIVGGQLTGGQEQGRRAGQLALRLLRGKSAESLGFAVLEPSRLAFDAEALRRFEIPRSALPLGSVVTGEAPSFYQQHRALVWSVVGGFAVLTALSAVLLALLGQRRRAEQAVADSEARFRSVFDNAPLDLVLKGLDGRVLLANRSVRRLWGVAENAVRGMTSPQVLPEAMRHQSETHDREVLGSGRPVEREYVSGEGGAARTSLEVRFPVRDPDGDIVAIGSAGIDISERKRALEALARSELLYQDLYDSSPDLYFTLGTDTLIRSVNRFGADYLGYRKHELEASPLLDLVHPADRMQVTEEFRHFLRGDGGGYERKAEFRMLRKNGDTLWVHMRIRRAQRDTSSAELRVICRDITEAHKLSEELAYQATHDPLTGLVNRREFERRLGRALKAMTSGSVHALCYLDLDQFKVVNDTCGHVAGDELLRQLGEILRERVRGRDVVARLGGDEFAVFMEHCPMDQALRIAEEIRAAVEDFRFAWNEQMFNVGTSIGLVPVVDPGRDTVHLLSAADAACYVAKEQGRNRVHVYTPDSAELARHHGEMQWVSRLHQALEENTFELWYQPIAAARDRGPQARRPHVELLLRLSRPGRPPVLPGAFLPSAERFGLAGRIDRWVVRHALTWLAINPSWLDTIDTCFINLSGHSLVDQGFLDFVIEQFRLSGLAPNRVCFEITETAAISNLTRARDFIATLNAVGCSFALDDFGSGLSSFAHLKRLPVDYVKIDGGFVRDIVHDPVDAAMVRSITEIAKVMGKRTIAEFVETADVQEMLLEIGVDNMQGHHVGRPRPMVVDDVSVAVASTAP